MKKIVWLASYPKSGNTWVRALLTNYLRPGAEPASINDLLGAPSASWRKSFDELAGVEASSLDPDTVDRVRPEVYRCLAAEANDDRPLFIKVHDAWGLTDTGARMFPAEVTAGVIYIMRNPFDTAVSIADHFGRTVEWAVEQLCDPRFSIGATTDRLHDQLRQKLGSWRGHVGSWLDASGLRCHVVRYEDLSSDPEAALASMLRFVGEQLDSARISTAVASSAFAELRRQELAEGFRESSVSASGSFFRRGEVGVWSHTLPPELIGRLSAALGETMRRFGY
jgi:aryl sulfotransferase